MGVFAKSKEVHLKFHPNAKELPGEDAISSSVLPEDYVEGLDAEACAVLVFPFHLRITLCLAPH